MILAETTGGHLKFTKVAKIIKKRIFWVKINKKCPCSRKFNKIQKILNYCTIFIQTHPGFFKNVLFFGLSC